MILVLGISLKDKASILFNLLNIYGIGLKTSKTVLNLFKINYNTYVSKIHINLLRNLITYIKKNYQINEVLRYKVKKNVLNLIQIKCYRGIRYSLGLPVNGQRTRTNCRTAKKLNKLIKSK